MTPSQKRSLRIYWYGLILPWPLYPDSCGQPYHLALNYNGRRFPLVNDCIAAARQEAK